MSIHQSYPIASRSEYMIKYGQRQREATRYVDASVQPAYAHSHPAEVNRKLAEVHYTARVTELRDLIFQEETRFK